MSQVEIFKASERRFEPYGGPPGEATIARLIGPELSHSMGAGIATFDECSIEWTLLYDEVIVVLEGAFRLRVGVQAYDLAVGDVIWLPENTSLRYEGKGARVFYALSPVDWRRRHAL
jgi:ethanolamine utilization protein EutQ